MKNGSYQHRIIWEKDVGPKLPLVVASRHSMSLVVTRCHSLYHLLPFVVIRFVVTCCTTRCHSLSFVVTRCTTCCHSLYHLLSLFVPLVVTLCTTCCNSLSLDVPLVCLFINDRSSHWRCSIKKTFFKISYYSQEKTCVGIFFNKAIRLNVCNFIEKRQVFSCEYFDIIKNTYFEEHLQTTASGNNVNIVYRNTWSGNTYNFHC